MWTGFQDMSFCRVDDLGQVHKVLCTERKAGMSNLKIDMSLWAYTCRNTGVTGNGLRKLILEVLPVFLSVSHMSLPSFLSVSLSWSCACYPGYRALFGSY